MSLPDYKNVEKSQNFYMLTHPNVQAYKTIRVLGWVGLHVFEWTRIPVIPVYGGFPVKLITHIGKQISRQLKSSNTDRSAQGAEFDSQIKDRQSGTAAGLAKAFLIFLQQFFWMKVNQLKIVNHLRDKSVLKDQTYRSETFWLLVKHG